MYMTADAMAHATGIHCPPLLLTSCITKPASFILSVMLFLAIVVVVHTPPYPDVQKYFRLSRPMVSLCLCIAFLSYTV